MSRPQRIELLLFTAAFFAFAYFNQGGGWNQNARFAEVRAMAEQGRFAIDDYIVYQRDRPGDELIRVPVEKAEYTLRGKRFRLAWVDMSWNLFPVGEHPVADGVEKAPMVELCASGDIGYVPATGHFHPNKPPGTSFLALPGYWLIYQAERLLGINPDHWWTLIVNAWLTTVCSVGLISALSCVLFFRLAREFANGDLLPATLATIAFAFGTMFLPFGTILFDHNLTAALLVAAFYLIRRAGAARCIIAGICAGLAAITNNLAAVAVIILGLYALLANRPSADRRSFAWRPAIFYSLGVLPPFLLICWYSWVNFGSPFKLNTDFQNPLFKDPRGMLGMFIMPSAYVAGLISFSPFRGIFFLSPVLIMGIYGLVVWLREKRFVPEARLCAAMFGFFFFVNVCFNGYHGGFACGPRYLIPAMPFLALPLVVAFARWRIFTGALAAISIAYHLLFTATDAQSPVGVGGHARVDGREDATYNLVADYHWPLFLHGRAWPLLEEIMDVHMAKEEARIAEEVDDAVEEKQRGDELRRDLRASIERGEPSPFLLASIRGPVSVNPVGVYEGTAYYVIYPPHSPQTRWSSFNVGELFLPESRLSLLPLLLISGGLCVAAVRMASRAAVRV